MRNLALFLSLVTILLLGGCSKGKRICCEPVCCATGLVVTAHVADSIWAGEPEATLKNDTITIRATHRNQILVFALKFKGKGDYRLDSTNTTFFTATNWSNSFGTLFKATNDDGNLLHITDYNRDTYFIGGTFDCKLKSDAQPNSVPINLHLADGTLRLALPK